MAEVFAGGQIPAPEEALLARFCGGLLTFGSPGGHVLGLTQPVAVTEPAVGIGGVLLATHPDMFEQSLHGDMLAPLVLRRCWSGLAAKLTCTYCVQ